MGEAGLAERPKWLERGNPRFKRAALGALVFLVAAAGLGVARAALAARQGSNGISDSSGNGLYTDLENCLNAQGQTDFSLCSPGDSVEHNMATGYVLGAGDVLALYGAIDIPEDATNGQIVDIVRMYLEHHPGTRNLPSAILIRRALRGAWPPKNVP